MDIWQWLCGEIAVELTSADMCGFLASAQKAQIDVNEVEITGDFTLQFRVSRKNCSCLQKLVTKRGEKLRVLRRIGPEWHLRQLRKRPVLIVGLLCLLILSLWIPSRVFFVRVEGNVRVPARKIAESAAQCGIGFGASRRQVRSEKIKNALLGAMPELSWAGVNTYGCTAVISVRERTVSQTEAPEPTVSSIVALRDGVIQQVIVERGNPLCTVGQAVKQGQVLISGYTDCGLTVQATNAQGEVYAHTSREITAMCPYFCCLRGEIIDTTRNYSLIIGNKRINFANNSGISGTGCAKIYEEKYIILPGGFSLPIALCVETVFRYAQEQAAQEESRNRLPTDCRQYLLEQMCAGSIYGFDEQLLQYEQVLLLRARYSCLEMIGISQVEENMPYYVEND